MSFLLSRPTFVHFIRMHAWAVSLVNQLKLLVTVQECVCMVAMAVDVTL